MSAPYYTDGDVTLHHGDCREVRAWLEANVLVTDPPYGMRYVSGQRTRSAKADPIAGDDSPALRDRILEAWGPRPALVFGTWRVSPPAGEIQRLVWWKRGGGPGMGDLSIPWGTTHEDIYVLGSGWDRAATGVTRSPSVIVSERGMGSPNGVVAESGHPTAKPVPLMEVLIARCPPGVVADPCSGGGSTLLAARNLGRKAIGVEVDERYCEVIARRLSQGVFDLGGIA